MACAFHGRPCETATDPRWLPCAAPFIGLGCSHCSMVTSARALWVQADALLDPCQCDLGLLRHCPVMSAGLGIALGRGSIPDPGCTVSGLGLTSASPQVPLAKSHMGETGKIGSASCRERV